MTEPGTALTIPDDVRTDLLRAQAGSITTSQALPTIIVMAGGVGLFEFPDEKRTDKEFTGVVLNNHSRNVLWDKPMGTATPASDENAKLPACSSNDGIYGIPRKGFAHEGLADGEVGDGVLRVACASCPYNKWGTGNKFNPLKKPKGKAVTNQRAVYILLPGKEIPYRLTLSPISLSPFDKYLTGLLSRSLPVQGVLTKFTQDRKEANGQKFSEVAFSMESTLSQEEFIRVLVKRNEWQKSIMPSSEPAPVEAVATAAEPAKFEDFPSALQDQDDELPF